MIKIKTTSNYGQFKFHPRNRPISLRKVKVLINKMKIKYLVNVIVVNEKMEIIDGQHSFKAIKFLELPINYVMAKGYGLKEIKTYNTDTNNWTMDDFAKAHRDKKDYKKAIFFKEKYNFNWTVVNILLSGLNKKEANDNFMEGTFKIDDYSVAEKYADMISGFEPFVESYKTLKFLSACLHIFKYIPEYDHERMLKGLSKNKDLNKVKQQAKAIEYIDNLSFMYNYSKGKKNRIEFVFGIEKEISRKRNRISFQAKEAWRLISKR